MQFEFAFLDWLQTLHAPVLDKIMIFITSLGNGGLFWIALAVVLLFFKRTRLVGVSMIIAMALGALIGNIIKPLVHRARPCWINETIQLLIAVPNDYSFPSGHTLVSFAAAVSIWLHNKRWGAVALILAALIAFSRMYLYVHFPTDILVGLVIGICVAIIAKQIVQRIWEIKTRAK